MNILKDLKEKMAFGGICSAIAGAVLYTAVVATQYTDFPGFNEKNQAGRTKNSIATIVGGITGQKTHGNSQIDLEVKKVLFPDARLTGYTTNDSIKTYVPLTFTSSRFSAKNNATGNLEGTVEKSEFDWNVKQTGEDTYEISRFGWKFNTKLQLTLKNGKITGTYIRPFAFDWDIKGTYDKEGNTKISIDAPLTLGIDLEGKITGAKK